MQLTAATIDYAAEHVFMHGGCAALAIALHDETGWPLVAITDADNCHDGHIGMGGSALHWTVRHPSGQLLDILGLHTQDDLVAEFHDVADGGEVAAAVADRDYVIDEYVIARGEPTPITVAATFVAPVLELAVEQLTGTPTQSSAL